ncbi:hypothetical protein QE152_g9163 [Popillia japonica]|uniref:Uncharacterized protein n=1 Tax=Popillia japonica TaxID=7064 RepID=A0AAW1M024_POPJA
MDSEPSAPSKRLERSPVRNQAHGRSEDSGESQLLERGNEELQGLRKENALMRKEISGMREEMQEWKRMYAKEREEWKKEKKVMGEKIEKLEDELWSLQKRERRKGKNGKKKKRHMVIKGEGTEKIRSNVDCQRFIQAELGVQAQIQSMYRVGGKKGRGMVVATVGNWEEKRLIMSNKQKLKGKRVYIDDDLTKREREIQGRLIEVATAERNRGKQVRVGYQKISVEGKWMRCGVDIGTEENEKND